MRQHNILRLTFLLALIGSSSACTMFQPLETKYQPVNQSTRNHSNLPSNNNLRTNIFNNVQVLQNTTTNTLNVNNASTLAATNASALNVSGGSTLNTVNANAITSTGNITANALNIPGSGANIHGLTNVDQFQATSAVITKGIQTGASSNFNGDITASGNIKGATLQLSPSSFAGPFDVDVNSKGGASKALIPVNTGVCFLTRVYGEFAGVGEWAQIVNAGGIWALQVAAGSGSSHVGASAMCFIYNHS